MERRKFLKFLKFLGLAPIVTVPIVKATLDVEEAPLWNPPYGINRGTLMEDDFSPELSMRNRYGEGAWANTPIDEDAGFFNAPYIPVIRPSTVVG